MPRIYTEPMNTIEDPNLDPLFIAEAHLDGESDRPGVAESVLESLRAERAGRAAYFAANERPEDASAVDRLLRNVRREANREQTRRIATGGGWGVQFGAWRVGVAAAACLAIGYFGGAFYRGLPASPARPGFVPTFSQPVDFSAAPASPSAGVGGAFVVPLLDAQGHVVATRRFDTREEARQFIENFRSGAGEPSSPSF